MRLFAVLFNKTDQNTLKEFVFHVIFRSDRDRTNDNQQPYNHLLCRRINNAAFNKFGK